MPEAQNHTVAHVLGEMTWLISQTPGYQNVKISDLEWLVMPAILLKQFRIFYKEQQPIAFAVWAFLSDEASHEFSSTLEAGIAPQLKLKEWKSGENPWLLELICPYATEENGLMAYLLKDLGNTVFSGKKFHYFSLNKTTGIKDLAEIDDAGMGHA